MATIKPYQVNIAQEQIDDLKARLENTIMPSEVKNGGWAYGPTNEYIKDMIDNIVSGEYDWRTAEAKLNSYPQFTTEVDGQEIYFMHVESKVKDATPLMLIHGWPGSIVEFLDVIEPLTDPVKHGGKEKDAFHLVIPSIPGFGFSGSTAEAGWNNDRIAAAFDTIMDRLGYKKYGVQGGDAGAVIAPAMGRLAPENVIGVHVNAATVGFMPFGEISEEELADPVNDPGWAPSAAVRTAALLDHLSELLTMRRFAWLVFRSS